MKLLSLFLSYSYILAKALKQLYNMLVFKLYVFKELYSMSEGKKHLFWLSFIKGAVIITVVFGHAIQQGPVTTYLHSFNGPLLFFMSGVVFSTKGKQFLSFVGNKARTLLVPYFIFGLLSILAYMLLGVFVKDALADQRVIEGGFLSQIQTLILGECPTNAPLWFLPSMFFIMLISFPIGKITDMFEKRSAKAIVSGSFMLLFILWAILNSLFFKIPDLYWNFDTALYMTIFFLFGYFLMQSGFAERLDSLKTYIKIPAGILLMAAGGFFAVNNEGFLKVRILVSEYGNIFMFFLAAFLGVLGSTLLCMSIKKSNLLDYLGRHTLSILVMHKFPIVFFQALCTPIALKLEEGSILVGLLVTAVSIALPLLAELIIDRIFPPALAKKWPKRVDKASKKQAA